MRQGYFKEIDLKGIARAMSNDVAREGVCEDMLNMRLENGSWKPMEIPKEVYDMGEDLYSRLWIHTGSDYRNVLGVKDEGLWWFAEIDSDGVWQGVTPTRLCDVGEDDLCTENGNLVTVGGKVFLLWKKGDNKYVKYDYDQNGSMTDETLVPDGNIDFRCVQDRTDDGGVNAIYVQRAAVISSMATSTYSKVNITEQDAVSELEFVCTMLEKGHRLKNSFFAPFLVCTALKTYTGDYVLASRPKLMNPQSLVDYSNSISANDALGNNFNITDTDQHNYFLLGHSNSMYSASADLNIRNVEKLERDSFDSKGTDCLADCTIFFKNNKVKIGGHTNSGNKYLTMPDNNFPTFVGNYTGGATGTTNLYASGSKTKLQIKGVALSESDKTIYTKLCVFITPMVRDYNFSKFYNYDIGVSGCIGIHREKRDPADVIKDLRNMPFYKLAELEVTSLTGEWVDVKVEDGVLLNIVQQDTLQTDATNRNGIMARGSYNYNGRLHLFDYDSTLFHGWPLNYFFENDVEGCLKPNHGRDNDYVGHTTPYTNAWLRVWEDEWRDNLPSWYVAVDIEKDDGMSRVVRYAPFEPETTKLHPYINNLNAYARDIWSLNGCLSYPDARAKSMTIYVKSQLYTERTDKKDTYKKLQTFALEPHLRLDMAMYIDPELKPINLVPSQFNDDGLVGKTYAPSESNVTTRYENGLKVSAVDNPLYLPAESTYRIGSRGIVGMCANEVAVGAGQTGDAPLMVFCKDGVYGLFVDTTGQIAYGYSRPLSSDICTNANSIRRVDGGIVFGTDRGLMMFKGTEVADIGEICVGRPIRFTTPSATEYVRTLTGAFTHGSIGGFGLSMATDEDFRDYIRHCEVGYNYQDKVVVVARPDKEYYYQKTFGGIWTRTEGRVSEIIDHYPECFIVKGGKVYDLDRYKGVGSRRVFLLTRPIAGRGVGRDSGDMFKENYRVVVKGEMNTGSDILGLYVVGSYDGKRWSVLGGNERRGRFSDIGCLVERVDVRYIMVCLSGTLGTDGYVDSIMIESKYK